MATNVITASFAEGCTSTKTAALWQWDYGQVLQITGLELPQSFEAHFTNTPGGGHAKVQIGLNGQVSIPDRYFESGQPIYCYIYLHSGAADGETEYAITIPVKPRAVPLGEAVTHEEQGVIQQYMAALQAGVTAAETSADESAASATESANSATASAESATEAAESATAAAGSATQAAGAATDAEAQVQAATAQAEAAAASATASGSYAAQAAQEATEAAQAAQSADASATDAETAKTGAEASQTQAAASAAQAAQSVTDAAGQVTLASGQAQAAAQSAQTATAQAQAAEAAKTAAQAAQTGAEQAKADTEALLSTKGDALSYNTETGALDLKSGDMVLSSVIIEAGGTLTLGYDQTTGRLSLLKDGTEISYVILSGLPVTITRDGDTLRVNNVPAVTSITQTDGTLALT